MKKFIIIAVTAFFVAIAMVGLSVAGTYNTLVSLQTTVEQRNATVDATLQRRYDLIPNVVNSVRGYMEHESEIFTEIADARSRIGSAKTADEKQQANSALESAVSRLLVLTENYPALKADAQVSELINQLEGTENRIFVARNDYNEAVTSYNNSLRRFPTNIVAGMFNFQEAKMIEATHEAKTEVPKVDLKSKQ